MGKFALALYPFFPSYFGFNFKAHVRQGYMSGGAGYVLSKEAVRRFVQRGLGGRHGVFESIVGFYFKHQLMLYTIRFMSLNEIYILEHILLDNFAHGPSTSCVQG